jgi:hypothetical protein
LLPDTTKHILFATLLELTGKQQFIENVVSLGEGEDDVQLAHVSVVLVHLLDVSVDDFESDQFVVFGGATCDKKQRCVAAVHNLGVYD